MPHARRYKGPKPSRMEYGHCTHCDKRTWASRKQARSQAKTQHPDARLHAYRCPHRPGTWHYGHYSARARKHPPQPKEDQQ